MQQQVIRLNSQSLLLRGIQTNQLIGHATEDSEMCASSEDLDLEEDDG